MKIIVTAAASAAILFAAAGVSYAQQGTTLAGPAQGSKADGSNSTVPSAQSGANGGAMVRSGGGGTGTSGAATGEMSGKSTATGGNVGGAVGRN